MGLHDEHVGATDRIAVFDVDLAVRELGDIRRALHDVEFSTDVGDELCGGSTCDNVQLLVIQELHPVPPVVPSQKHPTLRVDSVTRSTPREISSGFAARRRA